MPQLILTEEELADLAMALRAAAWRAGQDADAQANTRVRAPFAASAERYEALSIKVERASTHASASPLPAPPRKRGSE